MLLKTLGAALLALAAAAPAHAEWQEARSNHFLIYADEPAAELRAYAVKLERFDQAVRAVRKMSDFPLSDPEKLNIFVLPTDGSIEKLFGARGVEGFYIPRVSGSVVFVPRRAGGKGDENDTELDPDAIFFHEYAHHLQLQSADAALPPWVTEGFAEFFARTQFREDGTIVIGISPAYRAWSLFEYNSLSLRKMLGADTDLSDSDFEGIYSRGWLLTHYLTFNRARHGQLERYLSSIQQGVPPLEAAQQAFGDLIALSSEIDGYLRNRKLPSLELTGVKAAGPISIRELSPAEAAIMNVHIRSERGATKRTAGDIAHDAREVADRYPNDPFVQTALAQAEYDAKDYAAANSAADRALAGDPSGFKAMLFKGKAEMELARQSGHAAINWSDIRQWFVKANKLDAEAAEPLALFYQSYLDAGERPTKNAVDGLQYALMLVPQDTKLRLTLVHEQLADGDSKAAKRYFAAFAYEPHSKKEWRDAITKSLAAMDEGRSSDALKEVEQLQKLLNEAD